MIWSFRYTMRRSWEGILLGGLASGSPLLGGPCRNRPLRRWDRMTFAVARTRRMGSRVAWAVFPRKRDFRQAGSDSRPETRLAWLLLPRKGDSRPGRGEKPTQRQIPSGQGRLPDGNATCVAAPPTQMTIPSGTGRASHAKANPVRPGARDTRCPENGPRHPDRTVRTVVEPPGRCHGPKLSVSAGKRA